MPIYEYRCENGHTFEVMQRMTDDPIAVCQTCAAPVQRVFHPIAVHFKGSGFYSTDYGSKNRARELDASAKEGADKHDAKTAEAGKSGGKSDKSDKSGKSGGSSTGSDKSSGSSSSGAD
jgi:putative FmdB family regulatory protein